MLKKAITLTIITTMLSACTTGPGGYLKRSANNKLFDRYGFEGKKRSPLYNKKYISRAKKNILRNNIDEDLDEEDYLQEEQSPSQNNIEMYKEMIDYDMKKKQRRSYPSVSDAKNRIDPRVHTQNLELQDELNQIKAMLRDTRKEMASYRCPTEHEQENKAKEVIKNNNPPKPALDTKKPEEPKKKINDKTKGLIKEKHVHSI